MKLILLLSILVGILTCSSSKHDRGGFVEADAKAVAAELKARLSAKPGK